MLQTPAAIDGFVLPAVMLSQQLESVKHFGLLVNKAACTKADDTFIPCRETMRSFFNAKETVAFYAYEGICF